MAFTTANRNDIADYQASKGNWIAQFTADGGETGANESAAARVQTTWAAAVAGDAEGSQVKLTPASGETITHWGIFSAATGGTFLGSWQLSSPQSAEFYFTPSVTV